MLETMPPFVVNMIRIINTGLLCSLVYSCQTPFESRFGVCLFWNTSVKVSWCASQAYCGQFNGELVTGQNVINLNGKSLGVGRYFIGLTDLLNERRNNRNGWRWTDGSLEPSSSLLSWNDDEPGRNNLDADFVSQFANSGQFGDVRKYSPYSTSRSIPMCQPRQDLSPTWKTKRSNAFKAVPVTVFFDPLDYAGDGGCTRDITEIETARRCAVECLGEELDWCVAFYYHAGTQLCKLVLYTDQAIDVGNGVGWTKLVREK